MRTLGSEIQGWMWLVTLFAASCGTQVAKPDATVEAKALGTPANEVGRACWFVFQAQNGDYWFGTDGDGVYRHDGRALLHYTTADGLSSNGIRDIQGDKSGNVYFTTFGGICKFDGHTFQTLPVAATPPDGGWRLHPDDLWFRWFKGMPGAPDTEGPYRFDGTSLYHLKLPPSEQEAAFRAEVPNAPYSPYEVFSLYRDSRGHVWIGTSNFGACRYDGKSFGWLYEELHTKVGGGRHFGLRSLIEDRDGSFWICNTQNRYRVEPGNRDGLVPRVAQAGVDERLTGGMLYFQGAVRDADGNLWLAPWGGGIWRYDGERITNFPVKSKGQDIQVVTISKDNAGGLWLGTPEHGPYRFDGQAFEPFVPR